MNLERWRRLRASRVLHALAYRCSPVRRSVCVACGRRMGGFLPFDPGPSGIPRLLSALRVVGSDVDNFECAWCGALDRTRHLILYLRATGLEAQLGGASILHFAPERQLANRIIEAKPARYVRCDLYPATPELERIDVTDIPFEACTFDLVIANHVLEHVADDLRALSEIHRVLRPGGFAILQTPYSEVLERTWSDPGIESATARREAFGQEDHLRLYGRDIVERIASAGFEAAMVTHRECLSDCDPGRYGVNEREPFMRFRKSTAADIRER